MKLSEVNKKLGKKRITKQDIKLWKEHESRKRIKAKFIDSFFHNVWWANEGYERWMSKKKPIDVVSSGGCFSNSCDDNCIYMGCKCNYYKYQERLLLRKGFTEVSFNIKRYIYIWSNGKDVIHLHYSPGR